MNIIGIIPARFASTRFPGKPLVDIKGKTMIRRVYEQVQKAKKISDVIVATDDERIVAEIEKIGGRAIMTADYHESGTERCAEVLEKIGQDLKVDYVVNIQGDEPFINPDLIDELCEILDRETKLATAVLKIKESAVLFDPNVVKAVIGENGQALYFSRQAIPFVRGEEPENWLKHASFYKHIGIYAYRADILKEIVKLPMHRLESTEKLEQLRWLGHGYPIRVCETQFESVGIDTPEDLQKVKD
ncbi:3-deoxy-manno-octulosonate cytidylyltransferase [Marinilongibacter aquaticus]|uniref:3-deoxy-manno-octulosonate cytidylyltransferase n=1 Tax=Marinilongibacter aquaticus TaxID=2975157 RepID=UPI0021BD754C|nr:3-deoxy-manno-octulosonate cytidylyltransferase [Marinilongibacter aquaticus]UBM59322.1 3-deoxy-manno-octulosonate cytidylyltransferase [Marinilongibacter aquaticus]